MSNQVTHAPNMHFLFDWTYRASSQPILFLHVSPGIGRKRFWVLVPLLATYYPMTSKRLQIKFCHQGVSVHSTQIKGPLPMQKTFRAGKVKNRPIVRFFHINEHDIINEILWCANKTLFVAVQAWAADKFIFKQQKKADRFDCDYIYCVLISLWHNLQVMYHNPSQYNQYRLFMQEIKALSRWS